MCFSLAGATNYTIGPKMSLGSSGIDFDLILAAFGEPKIRQSRFQEGVEKIIDFRDPCFLVDFGCPGGPKKKLRLALFCIFFGPGGYFF